MSTKRSPERGTPSWAFSIDVDEAPCGEDHGRQVLVAPRVHAVEARPSDAQRAVLSALHEGGGVVAVARFDVRGPADDGRRAAAFGIVRRGLWSSHWPRERVAAVRLFPRRLTSQTEPVKNVISHLRGMLVQRPNGVWGAPGDPLWLASFFEAWLGPNAYERLRTEPAVLGARRHGPEVCPEYFPDGDHSWGHFLYTFEAPGGSHIVAMAASTAV